MIDHQCIVIYHPDHHIIDHLPKGEDLTTEDMMSFYECSDFAFNFNLIVKLKSDNLTGDNIKDAVSKKEKFNFKQRKQINKLIQTITTKDSAYLAKRTTTNYGVQKPNIKKLAANIIAVGHYAKINNNKISGGRLVGEYA